VITPLFVGPVVRTAPAVTLLVPSPRLGASLDGLWQRLAPVVPCRTAGPGAARCGTCPPCLAQREARR